MMVMYGPVADAGGRQHAGGSSGDLPEPAVAVFTTAAEGRSMSDLLISCGSCYDELRIMTFYEPPHDIRHRQAGPWLVSYGP
jgi:hypothetical protein